MHDLVVEASSNHKWQMLNKWVSFITWCLNFLDQPLLLSFSPPHPLLFLIRSLCSSSWPGFKILPNSGITGTSHHALLPLFLSAVSRSAAKDFFLLLCPWGSNFQKDFPSSVPVLLCPFLRPKNEGQPRAKRGRWWPLAEQLSHRDGISCRHPCRR